MTQYSNQSEHVNRIKEAALSLVPAPLRLPARYYWASLRRTLEFEATKLVSLVGPGVRAIDVGAHHGLYTYILARYCRHVEAFEPDPYSAQTMEWWGSQRVTVHRTALSDFSGTAVLSVPIVEGTLERALARLGAIEGQHQSLPVSVRRLDEYEFRDVSFIKIDVEGHEQQVLAGAKETIRRERPAILVEIEQRHLGQTPIKEVFKQFEDLGYFGSFFWGDSLVSVQNFSLERHQHQLTTETPRRVTRRPLGYVNNFLFRTEQ